MVHTDIISLADAKVYLSLDDNSRDAEVNRMIKSAIRFVEQRTNHVLVAKNKDYDLEKSCVRVYDFPITSTLPATITETKKPTYSIMTSSDSDATMLTLALGYSQLSDVPEDLIEGCYLMLKFYFYEQEGSGKIPRSVFETVDPHKRFIL